MIITQSAALRVRVAVLLETPSATMEHFDDGALRRSNNEEVEFFFVVECEIDCWPGYGRFSYGSLSYPAVLN